MNLFKKYTSGALQFTILIYLIIISLVGALILITSLQLKFNRDIDGATEVIHLAFRGIKNTNLAAIAYNDTVNFVSEKPDKDYYQVSKSHWGIYDKLTVIAYKNKNRFTKTALMGAHTEIDKRVAIHTAASDDVLSVTGSTLIAGDAVVSSSGMEIKNIKNNFYIHQDIIKGEILKTAGLPSIPEEKRAYLFSLTALTTSDFKTSLNFKTVQSSPIISNDTIVSESEIILDKSYKQTTIISSRSIEVSAFAKAENLILIAPEVIIKSGFKGELQVIASKNITVESNVRLSYPSALVLTEDDSEVDTTVLIMSSLSKVEGSIIALSDKSLDDRTTIEMPKGVTLTGELYSESPVDIKGTVIGSVYAQQFNALLAGTNYQHLIANATLDVTKLDVNYCGIAREGTSSNTLLWFY